MLHDKVKLSSVLFFPQFGVFVVVVIFSCFAELFYEQMATFFLYGYDSRPSLTVLPLFSYDSQKRGHIPKITRAPNGTLVGAWRHRVAEG